MARHTKIVATLGPASTDPVTLERLIRAGDDTGLRRHDLAQRAQLLLEQGQRFRNFNQNNAWRRRILRGAVEKLDAGFRNIVMA